MRRSIQGASPKRKRKITIPHDHGVQTSDAEIQDSVRESEPQQIELEMQNEDLRKSLTEVEEARRKYADLYDFAPIGYFTFDKKGCILEANATGAFLLGIDKRQLAGVPFISFLNSRYQTIFYSHLQKARELHKKQTRRVRLTRIDGHPFDALIETIAVTGASGKFDQYRSSILDLSEMGTLGEPINDIDRKHRKLVEELQQGTWSIDRDGYTIFVNPRMAEMLGYTVDEMRGKHLFEFMNEEGKDIAAHYIERCRQGIKEQYDFEFISKDGTRIYGALESSPIFDDQGNYAGAVASVMDITERKQAEVRDLLAREVLELLNRLEGSPDTVRDILQLIKKNTCFEAVGIRLREGDDFPYYETNGFSEDFIQAERYLCARDEEGKIIRDGQGNPVLECMCGNILRGRTDPALPFFTEGGSFWSNCTTELLASTTEKDRQARTRNRCNGEGYESVGLIPLSSGDEIIGLLQLNDRRRNQFTPEMIRFFEGLGASIGIALSRKQAEEALRESEEKYRLVVENAGEAIIIAQDGMLKFVNLAAIKLLGYSEEELTSTPFTEFIHQEDRQLVFDRYAKRLKGEELFPVYSFRVVTKEGIVKWVEIHAAVVPWQGRPATLNFLHDITDRRHAEKALRTSARELRTSKHLLAKTFSSLREAILIIDAKSMNIIDCNASTVQIFGYAREELIGQTTAFLHVNEDPLMHFSEYLYPANEKNGFLFLPEFTMKRKDGSIFPAEHSVTALENEGGEIIGWVSVIRDVTEQKKADDERQNLELQLRQVQKLEAIGTLAGGIAHDFNNILASIIGYTELAFSEELPDKASSDLQHVLKAAERARNLVAQILSFSRPGKAEKRTLQISHIIQEALKLLRPSLPSTIDIKRQIKVKSDSVLADPSHIHQIIMNLCTNAAHAMRAQGGALTVALGELEVYPDDVPIHPKLGPGSYLDLSVSDTGHGIHPDIMDRIFDPFFTTKIPEEGTGIGLAVVYGIVNNMGGVITVHSEPGSGTNFHVYLPKSSSEPIAESRREDAIPTGTERILLVDDEADIADMDRQILQRLGYSVVSTTSSPEALKIFKDQPHQFDLVITDQTMPKMTGIDLSREIKRIRSDVPIILFSGLANIAEEKMKDNGISRYLTKPMSLPQLACAVREALDEYGKKGE